MFKRSLQYFFSVHPEFLKKMVFVAGPRQVGKTTLLEQLAHDRGYKKDEITQLNWDRKADNRIIRSQNMDYFLGLLANAPQKPPLVIFDEIHKYGKWKNFLKGYYDTFHGKILTLVTGSARLDTYRRGGDSLLGRYWHYRLYPFTLSEALGRLDVPPIHGIALQELSEKSIKTYRRLFEYGGFPEPYLSHSPLHHRQWIRLRKERLLKNDLRDLSAVKEIGDVEILMGLVGRSVGSTLSVNSLKEDLDVSYNAVKNWLKWLEALYYCFKIPPYSKKLIRALKKDAKYYLFDWSELKEAAPRFENMVALHLKKSVDYWVDTGQGDFELFYVRDQQKREVDFLLVKESTPWMLVECKLSRDEIPPSLAYMGHTFQVAHRVLLTHSEEKGRFEVLKGQKYWVSGAADFFQNLV